MLPFLSTQVVRVLMGLTIWCLLNGLIHRVSPLVFVLSVVRGGWPVLFFFWLIGRAVW